MIQGRVTKVCWRGEFFFDAQLGLAR